MSRTLRVVVLTCQAGFEDQLAREMEAAGVVVRERGAGWLRAASETPAGEREPNWCFAHAALLRPDEVRAKSVNALAGGIADGFFASAREERFETPWPWWLAASGGMYGLARRAAAVDVAARELVQRKMARVAKLGSAPTPRVGTARGLFALVVDFDRAFVAREAWFGGQRRMADDPAAPSRSFLKVEEAYGVLGREPLAGERVVDLGAAPGGWSYSAAKRGARVVAVDNGPLKAGALAHPLIEHRREDAFRFRATASAAFDWLFCDLVEEPHHVLRAIVEPWLRQRWCRRCVANLKFGRADPLALLREVRALLEPRCSRLLIRHLFHDREELTLVAELAET